MWIERQIFAIIEEHYTEVTLKNVHHTLSTKIEALLISVHNIFLCMDRTGGMEFISSEILSLSLRKSAECVQHILLAKQIPPKK
jgi:hypothetical protein